MNFFRRLSIFSTADTFWNENAFAVHAGRRELLVLYDFDFFLARHSPIDTFFDFDVVLANAVNRERELLGIVVGMELLHDFRTFLHANVRHPFDAFLLDLALAAAIGAIAATALDGLANLLKAPSVDFLAAVLDDVERHLFSYVDCLRNRSRDFFLAGDGEFRHFRHVLVVVGRDGLAHGPPERVRLLAATQFGHEDRAATLARHWLG